WLHKQQICDDCLRRRYSYETATRPFWQRENLSDSWLHAIARHERLDELIGRTITVVNDIAVDEIRRRVTSAVPARVMALRRPETDRTTASTHAHAQSWVVAKLAAMKASGLVYRIEAEIEEPFENLIRHRSCQVVVLSREPTNIQKVFSLSIEDVLVRG